MDANGQIIKPVRIELGTRSKEDEHFTALMDFYKDKEVPEVNVTVSEDFERMIQVEFYNEQDTLLDLVQFPYFDDLSEEEQLKSRGEDAKH